VNDDDRLIREVAFYWAMAGFLTGMLVMGLAAGVIFTLTGHL
jgi:hypothetical protein